MYRIILFISVSFLLTSCKDQERNINKNINKDIMEMEVESNRASREKKTMHISLRLPYDNKASDNEAIAKEAHVKVKGFFGDINSKLDATTGASTPSGVVKKINAYRYLNVNKYGERSSIHEGLRCLLIFGVSPYFSYNTDGFTGNGYGQKIMNSSSGPKITGTGIKKVGGIIIIRYVHAGGLLFHPTAYEIKSDQNGIFKVGKSVNSFKKSSAPLDKDVSFDDIEFVDDDVDSGVPYWEGDLRGTFDDNILVLKGTLVLME